jgi:hypothetical protein
MAKKKKRRANAESDSDTGECISHDPYEWIPVLRAESPAFEEIARLIDDDERIVDHIDEEGRVFLKSYPRSHMGKLVNVCLILDLAGRE